MENYTIDKLRRELSLIKDKVPTEFLIDAWGGDVPLHKAVDAMMIEIVSLRVKLRKAQTKVHPIVYCFTADAAETLELWKQREAEKNA